MIEEGQGENLGREESKELKYLIQKGLKKLGLSAGEVAEKVGITAGHFSHLVNGRRKMRKEIAVLLANILQIPRNELLQATGFIEVDEVEGTRLSHFIPQSLGGKTLKIVSDLRFVDSATFMAAFSSQPFRSIGIECELVQTDWINVPTTVDSQSTAIGFSNRKPFERMPIDVEYWTDLCLYKGYALITRPGGKLKETPSLKEAQQYLDDLCKKKKKQLGNDKPLIVSMGTDTVWRMLPNPLLPILTQENFEVKEIGDADYALELFINRKYGDLYIGGLTQRLKACKSGCVELVNFENNPLLFSMNSLICSPELLEDNKGILSAVSALWFETVRRIKNEEKYRNYIFEEIQRLLMKENIQNHSIEKEIFNLTFDSDEYEIFIDQPIYLIDSWMEIYNNPIVPQLRRFEEIVEQIKQRKINRDEISKEFENTIQFLFQIHRNVEITLASK